MRQTGMTVRRDNIGNLRGRFEGTSASTLLLGSHLDSVRDAGRYDGPLGVLVAIAAVQQLHDAGRRLPFALEVLAFADEPVVVATMRPSALEIVSATPAALDAAPGLTIGY